MKSVMRYVLYAVLLFGTLVIMMKIDVRLKNNIADNPANLMKWMTIRQFLYIPVGIVLALPYLYSQMKTFGSWKVNYKKLVIIGIPALCTTFFFFIYYSELWIRNIIPNFLLVTFSNMLTYQIGGIILGYVLLTSFYKKEDQVKARSQE